MCKSIVVLLSLLFLSTAAFAATPADDVRAAETAFAKAFADRDAAKFFSFVAEDATFFGGRPLEGKAAVTKAWSRFFESKEAPFRWQPEKVATNAAGAVGFSSGPVFDPKGEQFSTYTSMWMKQSDGTWKVMFDGPGCPKCPECEKK